MSSDLDEDEDNDHFVDFGLVELNEMTSSQEEDSQDRAWLNKFTSAPESDNLVQLDKDDETHVVFHKGQAKIVPATLQLPGESPRLAQPLNFMILSLDSHTGFFKMKQYNRTYLSEMRDMFEDVLKIRGNNSEVIMVGN